MQKKRSLTFQVLFATFCKTVIFGFFKITTKTKIWSFPKIIKNELTYIFFILSENEFEADYFEYFICRNKLALWKENFAEI